LVILGVLALAGWRMVERKAAARAAAAAASRKIAVPVTTAPVVVTDLDALVRVTGTVEPDQKAALASKISGRVDAVLVREGDRVQAGQVLVRLDDSDVRAQVAQAQAAVQAAEAARGLAQSRLELALAGARPQERRQAEQNVAQAKAALSAAQAGLTALRKGARSQERAQAQELVRQAKAGLDNAEANLRRAEDLYRSGAIPAQQLDMIRTQRTVAQSQYQSATQQLDLVKEGARAEEIQAAEDRVKQAQAALRVAQQQLSLVREGARPEDIQAAREQVNQAQAAIAQARAALQAAQVMLANTVIRSSIAGEVAQRAVDPGQTVVPSQPLLIVVDNRVVFVRAKVSEAEIAKVRPGQAVQVEADAYPGQSFAGAVQEILPAAQVETRMFFIRLRIPNPQGRLKSGMFARGAIAVARLRAIAAPRAAVIDDAGRKLVYVVRDGKAHQVPVALGIEQGDLVQVTSGLRAGEQVVVAGQHRLSDGDVVAIRGGA
jgi:HlyD family secretion protein